MDIQQTKTAMRPGTKASFRAVGGTEPIVYSLEAGGAGGTINPATGAYTAPAQVAYNSKRPFDTIIATDALDVTAEAQVLICEPLMLFCEILQKEMGLGLGRVYLWDQKIMQPKDQGLYIAVGIQSLKPFGARSKMDENGQEVQSANIQATLDVNIISRGPVARDRKEEVLFAINSFYSQRQQEANGFAIGSLPPGARFVNLSEEDGAAIPYRFTISVSMQYAVEKSKATPYFDDFSDVEVITNP